MNKSYSRQFAAMLMALTILILPIAATAQTQVNLPKNKYKIQDDVKLGNQAAIEVEKQFPIINDRDASAYIERVGERLVASIPQRFYQPEFSYRFKWVNASDINAFALPGGPMYVNRGMIEAAKNEGEMAGVMAHEISHVALRHATAQATKQQSAKNTLATLGMILGGAVLGGQAGAQLGQIGAAAWMTKYSREYESQADILGAQIMAAAGYDPHDLANMFKTIQQQHPGGGTPQWLSDHPDPGNRYEKINKEASFLQVSREPIKVTRDFERTQAKFRAMPRARSMAEIQKQQPQQQGSQDPSTSGQYTQTVQYPSTRVRTLKAQNWLQVSVPTNWIQLSGRNELSFAPEGAYGSQGITHGVMMGTYSGPNRDLSLDSQDYVNSVLQNNTYLKQRSNFTRSSIDGRQASMTSLSGRSPVTGQTEIATVYTTLLRNGELFYTITVAPQEESYNYSAAFRNLINSIQLND